MLMCPRCGKTGKEDEFIEAFCSDCYEFNITCPAEEAIDQCKHCRRMFLKGDWMKSKASIINEFITRKCKGEFSTATFDSVRNVVIFCIRKGERSFFTERPIAININTVTCPDCSRLSGGYYEAIIQLRGDEKKIEKYKKQLSRGLERSTFITKTEHVKGGIDIYSGSSIKTQELLGGIGLKCQVTRKLVGRKDGRRIYRTTYAVRF